jgi:GH24 family phage-related lysozyme (muramidase)
VAVKSSEGYLGFLRNEEGFRAEAYDDSFGNMTIGYGMTSGDMNRKLTQEEADGDMRGRVKVAEDELSRVITRSNLSQGQQDVLVDMHFNMGLGNMRDFIDLVNSGDDVRASQEILRYTKARDKKTGEMVEVEALQKRVKKRQGMWLAKQPIANEDDITAAIRKIKALTPTEDADIVAAINQAKMHETEMAQQVDANRLRNGLKDASDSMDAEIAIRNQEAKRLADRMGITFEDAQARLAEKDFNSVLADHSRNTVAEFFPAVAQWGQDPDNYVMLKETGSWAQKIELATRNLRKDQRNDWEKALSQNLADVEEAAVWPQIVFGGVSLEQGKKMLADLDQRRAMNQLTDPGALEIGQAIDSMDKGGDIWDVIKAMALNPRGAALTVLQSGGSSVAPLATGLAVGAGASFVATPVAGAIAGTTSAFATGHLLAYSGYMRQQLQEFKDPITGAIDYDKAFSDPQRLKQWQREADVYGAVMGVSDAFYSSIGGKFLLKHAAKGGAKSVAKGVAAEAAVGAVEEGLSETTALTAADLYAGRLTTEKLKKNVKEGQVEAVFGGIIGGTVGPMGAGVRYIMEKPADAAVKTMDIAKQANRANDDLVALSQLRAIKDQEDLSRENPAQVQDLIDAAITPPPAPQDQFSPVTDDVDSLQNSEMRTMDSEASEDVVAISPSEWDEYHKFQGINPLEAINKFGPNIVQAYARNKESDSSINIPVSEWLRYTEEDPAIDAIARLNGNSMNGLEANEYSEAFEKDPVTLFENKPTGWDSVEGDESQKDLPETPITVVEADPNDPGNLAMRPVELVDKFRTDDDKTAFRSLVSRLKRVLPDQDPKALEIFAEIQFNHVKARADMLGLPAANLSKKLKLGKYNSGDKSERGKFTRTFGDNADPYTVAFKPNADIKTLVHEFGHSWLHELSIDHDFIMGIPEDNLTPAQREYKNAMGTMAKLAGLDNIGMLNKLDPVMQTRIHETFARTTERYFLEGDLENNAMRGMMETFRKWVFEVIDRIMSVFNTNVYPPLKLTPEVTRMFEAILGVSAKVEAEVIPMFPEPLFDPEMLGPSGAKYIEVIKDARSEAIGRTYEKAWNKSIKGREAQINEEYNRIYLGAVAEVDSRRSMIMLAGFQDAYGEFKNDPEGDTPDPRFSFESIQRVLAKGDQALAEQIKEQASRFMIAGKKKGGTSVELYMHLNGINNPDEMLSLVLETGKREELIEARVNEKIAEDFPIMKTDAEIHEEAVKAVNSKGRERLLATEIGIMMDKYQGAYKSLIEKLINPPPYISNPSKEVIQAEGFNRAFNAKAFKFSANSFMNDSLRHARDAARKFKKNNIMEALDSKLKEAVHFYAYKAALGLQKDVANARIREKQLVKYARSRDVLRKYDADVMNYGRQVIAAVRSGSEVPLFDPKELPNYTGVSKNLVDDVNQTIEAFNQATRGRVGSDISAGGFAMYGDVLKKIMFSARKAKIAEVEGKQINRDMMVEQIAQDIQPKYDDQGRVVDVTSFDQGTFAGELNRSLVGTRALLTSLYPSKEAFTASYMGKLFNAVVNAEAERNANFDAAADKITQAVRDAVQRDKGLAAILAPLANRANKLLPFIPSMDKSGKPINGFELGQMDPRTGKRKGFTFANKGELYMAYLMMGSESGAKKFLLGHNLSFIDPATNQLDMTQWKLFDQRMQAEGIITQKDFEMFQTVWNVMEEIHPKVSEALRESDGWKMGKIQGWTVSTKWGDYKGGYVPVGPKDVMTPSMAATLINPDTSGQTAADLYPTQNTGLAMERSDSMSPVNLDMSRLNMYLSAALNIAYLRNPLLEFGKTIEHPVIKEMIEARRPGAIGDQRGGVITKWFDAVKTQTYTEYSSEFPQLMAKFFRQNLNMVMYLFNFMTPVKQYLGLAPAAGAVGGSRLIGATASFAAAPRTMFRETMAESKVMANRLKASQERMIRSWDSLDTNFDWISWTDEKKNTLQWFLIQKNQNIVDVITYQAAKSKAVSKGLKGQDAINFANDVVNTTQSSPDVSSMVNLQRGKDTWKLITSVTAVPITINNWTREETMRDATLQAKAKALAVIALTGYLAAPMIEGFVSEVAKEEDEDDERSPEERSSDAALTVAKRTMLGSIDTLLPWYSRPLTSYLGYGNPSVAPFFNKLQNIPKVGSAVKHLGQGVDLSTKEIVALMETASIVSGVPLNILGKGVMAEEFLQPQEIIDERTEERREQLAEVSAEE